MASDGGRIGHESPRQNCRTSTITDDEISVIAVIKKGTSGIPKRARYHYIRELPLTSVKSFKNSLQISARGLITTEESSVATSTKSISDVNKPRIIELSDEASKMELCKQFKMAEDTEEDRGEVISTSPNSTEVKIIHKLPIGTVLIKQEPKTPSFSVPEPRPDRSGFNTNGSSAGATTTTSSNISNSSSTTSSVSSCGSGSSSGDFGSRSPSPAAKVKRIHRAPKGTGRKKNLDVVPRRNPKRSAGSKKAIATEVLTTSAMARPRRLLATRRQGRNENAGESAGRVGKTKPTTMPYMNTRSVTRKLYTVGATYQAPTRKDETEWREWPVHGLHERPVFHPQVGVAAEYVGRIFWASPDPEGGNWAYREVMDAPEEVEVVPVDPRPKRFESSEEPFDVCMHESLHSVLAYCAQVMAPSYRRAVVKKQRLELPEARPKVDHETEADAEPEATQIDLTELEDSSISDETLMEMSSIYKKLLPIEDQPSSLKDSPSETPRGSPSALKNVSSVDVTVSAPKNASEASEIARILSEYNESLKETGTARSFSSTIPVAAFRDPEEVQTMEKTVPKSGNSTNATVDKYAKVHKLDTVDKTMGEDHWLEELLVDTSLLYCVATGVPQRDLTRYVDGLDAKQSLQWLRRRDV